MKTFDFIIPCKNIIIIYKKNTVITNQLDFFINKKLKKNLISGHISNQNLNIFKKILSNIHTLIEFWKFKKKIDKQYLINLYNSFNNKYDLVIIKFNYKSIFFDYKNQLIKKIFKNDFQDTNINLINEISNYINTSFIKIKKNLIIERFIDGNSFYNSKNNFQNLEKIYLSSINRISHPFDDDLKLLDISRNIIKSIKDNKDVLYFKNLNQLLIDNLKKFKFVVSYNDCSLHNLIIKNDRLYYIDINPRKISIAPTFYEFFCLIISSKVEYDIKFNKSFMIIAKRFSNEINIKKQSVDLLLYSTIVFMVYYNKINLNSINAWLNKTFDKSSF